MPKKNVTREAFTDIRTLLKERADSSRDVEYELIDAALTILEQVVDDLHTIAKAAADHNENNPVR